MGDPQCIERKERFSNVLIDYQPEQYFDARLVLKEEPYLEDSSFALLSMNLYLAPGQYMATYMKNMMYICTTYAHNTKACTDRRIFYEDSYKAVLADIQYHARLAYEV